MLIVFFGVLVCMILSFKEKNYIVGVLSGLTVMIPVIIWFSDAKDNEGRDKKLAKHENCLTWK